MIEPRRATGMVTYNRRPRSLWGSLSSVLLQPIVFYQAFPGARQWLWVAALILILYGVSAINQPAASEPGTTPAVEMPSFSPDMGGSPPGVEGGFIPPADMGGVPGGGGASAPNVSRTVMTALLAAAGVALAWVIQAVIFSEVSLINGVRPSFGRNLQIAVWATVPLGLMLLIQQIYFAIGGEPGQVGLSLLLTEWDGFATLPAFSRVVLMTLATNFTLFWLWSLVLLYLGGRYVLNGKPAAVALVVLAWVIISVFVPALTSPNPPDATPPSDNPGMMMPGGSEQMMPMETLEAAPDAEMATRDVQAPDGEAPVGEALEQEAPAAEAPAVEANTLSRNSGG